MPAVLVNAFGWCLTVGVCWCLGKLLLYGLPVQLFRQEENTFAFIAGSACLSTLVFLLCAAGWVHRGVLLGIAILIIAITWWKGAYRTRGESLPPMSRPLTVIFYGVYAVYAGLYLVAAFAPESSPDGAGYHLGLARLYLKNHGFTRITTNFYASFPQGAEMLFLYALAWGRYSAAALVHCTYLLALPWVILNYARRKSAPAAGVIGGLMIFTSPVAAIAGTSAYNDVAVACLIFTVFALLEVWDEQREAGLLIPIGIVAGFAVAVKYTAFVAVIYAVAYVAWRTIRFRLRIWRSLILVATCAGVMIAPTLIKNWIEVDNPVAPFFNRVFRNRYVHVSFENALAQQMRTYNGTIQSYSQIPLEVTVRGEKLQGLLGPAFLLAPLALFSLSCRTGRRLLAAALLLALPYPANIGTRFLLPVAVFVAPALGLVLGQWPGAAAGLTLAVAVSSWPGIVGRYCDKYAWTLHLPSFRAAVRLQPEAEYLSAQFDNYNIARMVEKQVPPGAKVFSISDIPFAYCDREVFVSFFSALTEQMADALASGYATYLQPRRGALFEIPPTPVPKLRIVQTGSGGGDIPSIGEVQLFGEAGPLTPEPSWRFTAFPYPWDAALAFDRRPVTRWRAWEPRFDGMYLEVDFGEPKLIRGVELDCSLDQALTTYEIQGQIAGRWITLSAAGRKIEVQQPPDYRRLAIDELKRHGIQYLLVQAGDYAAPEFKTHAAQWPMRPVSETRGAILFQLE